MAHSSPLRPLGDYQAYLLDVDGTLVYPSHAIPGAREALIAIKRAGKRALVVTNNSLLSRAEMAAKLRGFDFPIEQDDVATAVVATAVFIQQERPGARVHVLGSRGLREELQRAGLQLVDDGVGAEYLVVGTDVEVTYEKFTLAMRAANAGARFIAVNVDRMIPDARGGFPGAGMYVGAIRGATGRDPDVLIGKPSPLLLEEALTLLGLPASECLFVGDSLATDAAVARAAAMPCLLVLTGVTDRAMLAEADVRPDYVLESIADLIPHLEPRAARSESRSEDSAFTGERR